MSKLSDTWKIRSIVEHPISDTDAVANTEDDPLTAIGWLQGSWQDQGESESTSEVRFLPGQKFMIRTFSRSGESAGFQVIGYDLALKQIRSWSYFVDGTYGEATWRVDGPKVFIKSLQRLSDGGTASGTYVINRVSDDELSLRLVGHEVNGEPVPKAAEMIVERRSGNAETDDETQTSGAGE